MKKWWEEDESFFRMEQTKIRPEYVRAVHHLEEFARIIDAPFSDLQRKTLEEACGIIESLDRLLDEVSNAERRAHMTKFLLTYLQEKNVPLEEVFGEEFIHTIQKLQTLIRKSEESEQSIQIARQVLDITENSRN